MHFLSSSCSLLGWSCSYGLWNWLLLDVNVFEVVNGISNLLAGNAAELASVTAYWRSRSLFQQESASISPLLLLVKHLYCNSAWRPQPGGGLIMLATIKMTGSCSKELNVGPDLQRTSTQPLFFPPPLNIFTSTKNFPHLTVGSSAKHLGIKSWLHWTQW